MAKTRAFLDTNVLLRYLEGGTPEKLLAPSTLENVTYVINPVVLQELLFATRAKSQVDWQDLVKDFEIDAIDGSIFDNADVKRLLDVRNRAVHSSDFLIMASAATSNCDYLLSYDLDILRASEGAKYTAITPDDFVAMLEESA